jgi:hypothetical protein
VRQKKANWVIGLAVIVMIAVLILFSIVRTQRPDDHTTESNGQEHHDHSMPH